ncbi:hypothetical protein [Glycomyces terrestris]|uniref:Uncharacterized protein n=1 Tax=Glycomyces terrestris TaxID=2493553 RepID=A0A426UY26_9ACTN|nr:hypothetical protein [Glycomyces terrestris]RRR99472.1 hypothetical protein EIW28_12260 [Glycomyces terrestris]
MRKGLFRRTIRRARTARPSGPAIVGDAAGKRYRVVPVDDPETAKYADPPRKWPRVGAMAGAWAIVLALGAWAAPSIAASGSEENQDPRDQAATDAEGAAWSYLRYGSNEDLDRAEAALCEDASPELAPGDLDAIRESYADELGGITDIDLQTGDPVPASDGISITGTVSYIYQGTQRHEEFVVTVQENDGTYCVSDATQPEEEEPGSTGSDGSEGSTGNIIDPESLASEFLTYIVGTRNPQAASEIQCNPFSGITPEELDAAIDDWAATNGPTTGWVSVDPAESADDSTAAFAAEVTLQGELNQETFSFELTVEDDCVASLGGGDGLMDADD